MRRWEWRAFLDRTQLNPPAYPTRPTACPGDSRLATSSSRLDAATLRGDLERSLCDSQSEFYALTVPRDTATVTCAPNGGQKAGMMAAVSFLEIAAFLL